ncbi:ribonuclease H2, subunit C [Xylaria grammica]|nr:ribonuclease H2, subunit C [Xylaria grammica]
MPLPLFTVESEASNQEKAKVNLLPCRIHHDGDVTPSNTFWNPSDTQDGLQTAYFRGRKLHGKSMKLPEGYHGVVVEKTDAKPQTPTQQEPSDEDVEIIENPEDQLEVDVMRGKATFDEFTIWGHESTNDSSEDAYVRGMEEWIAFSEEIHSYTIESESSTK